MIIAADMEKKQQPFDRQATVANDAVLVNQEVKSEREFSSFVLWCQFSVDFNLVFNALSETLLHASNPRLDLMHTEVEADRNCFISFGHGFISFGHGFGRGRNQAIAEKWL